MKWFALLKLMYTTAILNGMNSHTLLYLILLAAGIGMRLVVKRKRDFGILAGVSAGLWIVCEILVDIGSVWEIPLGLFSAAYTVGSVCFCFAVGFLLCSLVCRLLHRRCII
ncbi:MAG: hypothetical protein U0N08_02520 [Oscillospiraceae bacterium]